MGRLPNRDEWSADIPLDSGYRLGRSSADLSREESDAFHTPG